MSVYLQNARLHYFACYIAVRDSDLALSIAEQIADASLRDRTVKKIALFARKVLQAKKKAPLTAMAQFPLSLDEKTAVHLVKRIIQISNLELRSKTADRFIGVIKKQFPNQARPLEGVADAKAERNRKGYIEIEDNEVLSYIQGKVNRKELLSALSIVPLIHNQKNRMEAYTMIAAAQKTEPSIRPPKCDAGTIKAMEDICSRLLHLDNLHQDQLDELASSLKKELINLAAAGQADETVKLAQNYAQVSKKFQSPKVEVGILNAACIVAIYNKDIAIKLAEKLTLPVRQIEAIMGITQITIA